MRGRIVRLVLVGLLAPLLVLLSGPGAQAFNELPYTDYSSPAKASVSLGVAGPENDSHCSIAAYWKVTWTTDPSMIGPNTNSLSLMVSGTCKDDFLADNRETRFRFDGGDCLVEFEAATGQSFGPIEVYVGNPYTGYVCVVGPGIAQFDTDACTDQDFETGDGDLLRPDCDRVINLALGSYPPYDGPVAELPDPECTDIVASALRVRLDPVGGPAQYGAQYAYPSVSMMAKSAGTLNDREWGMYAIVEPYNKSEASAAQLVGGPAGYGIRWQGYGTNDVPPGAATWRPEMQVKVDDWWSATKGTPAQVVGFGIWRARGGFGNPNIPNDAGSLPQVSAGGLVGVTDPTYCSFYWGAKIATKADTDTDEPVGTMPVEPGTPTEPEPTPVPPVVVMPDPDTDADPDGDGVPSGEDTDDDGDGVPDEQDGSCGGGFSFSDPESWLSSVGGAVACILVVVVQQLVKLVKAVGKLVGAIGTLLADLFIPSPGGWGFGGLKDQFMARPPGSVLTGIGSGMTSFAGGFSDGGCGVLADFGNGAEISCSNVKSVPGYSALYSLVQLALLSLTGLSVFRTLAGKVGGDTES